MQAANEQNLDSKFQLNNGNEFPVFGLGTYGITDSNVIKEAINMGYRCLDGASFYKNEEVVGQGIKDSDVDRSQLSVISKVWWDEVEDCEAACRRSLARLGVDYIDLYLVHWPIAIREVGNADGNDEGEKKYERINIPMYKIWAQMEALVDSGLVKNIGISNFNVQLVWDMLSYCRIKPAVNEVEIHPLNSQTKLVNYMKS
jgi:diketogulonate reductase-like aldo/keto reductase